MNSFSLAVRFWALDEAIGKKIQKQLAIPSCHDDTTIRELRGQIASASDNITPNQVILILQQRTPEGTFKGQILDDDRQTFSDRHVGPESLVYSFTRPPSWQSAVEALEREGLQHHRSGGDGNCLFRSVSKIVYGTEEHHDVVRQSCMDYMVAQAHAFEQTTASDLHQGGFEAYVAAKRKLDGSKSSWGDEPELLAISELYRRPVEVWTPNSNYSGWQIIRTYSESLTSRPIRVCFLGRGHYDAILPRAPAVSLTIAADGLDPTHPGKFEQHAIQQVENRSPEERQLIEKERAAYRQVLNRGNLDKQITEQVRQESLSQLRKEASRDLDQAMEESMKAEFQREIEAALQASREDAEAQLASAERQSLQDEDQRILDAARNASVADQQKKMDEAMEKAKRESMKEQLIADLMGMGVDKYQAEYAAANSNDVESAFAFLGQQIEEDLTPTSGKQTESQIIAAMVQFGFAEWEAQFAAKNASDLEAAMAFIESQRCTTPTSYRN